LAAASVRADPDTPQRRFMAVFKLAQHLRGVGSLAGRPADQLVPVVEHWHAAQPLLAGRWAVEDVADDFRKAWAGVRDAAGSRLIDRLWARAADMPVPAGVVGLPEYGRRVGSLCWLLQEQAGPDPFFLSCRVLEELAGTHYATCSRWLKRLVRCRFLTVAKKGNHRARIATQYRCPSAGTWVTL
jgi:hypothetical protein